MYLLKQDTDDGKSTLGESSTGVAILRAVSQGNTNGDEFPSSECLNRKGKVPENNTEKSSGQEKPSWKKNGISNDVVTPAYQKSDIATPVLEKDRQAKIKTQTMRSRQTQSGPLVPNAVLGHLPPEKWCTADRFHTNFY